jgi:hypothetical protein
LQKIVKNSGVLRRIGAVFVLATMLAAAAQPEIEAPVTPNCGESGYLSGRLYGAISATLDWTAETLQCEGMPRPGGKGARLRFAGYIGADARQVAIIIAIPELSRDSPGTEYASNVTVIEVGHGRFFNTIDLSNCLTDITAMTVVDTDDDRYTVSGSVYCVAPLAEVNGNSSVTIGELRFTGLIDWSASCPAYWP